MIRSLLFLSVTLCFSVSLCLCGVNTDATTETQKHRVITEKKTNSEWLEAERLAAEQTSESNSKAVELYRRAGESAKRDGQLQLAARALRRASEVQLLLGYTTQALQFAVESVALSRRAHDQTEEGFSQISLAHVYFLNGDSKEMSKSTARALQLARQINNQHLEALALSMLAEEAYTSGDLQLAQEHQTKAMQTCEALGEQKCQTRAAVALGYYLVNLSEPRKGISYFKRGLELAVRANDLQGQAQSLNAIGNIKLKVGEYQGALNAFNSARPLAERIGDRICLASIVGGMSGVYRYMGDTAQSLRLITESLNIFEEIDAKWGIAEAKLDQGRALKVMAQFKEADARFNEALKMFESFGMKRLQMQTVAELAAVQQMMGHPDKALAIYGKALSLSKAGQDQRHEAYILNSMGEVYSSNKDFAHALPLHQRALTLSKIAADTMEQMASLICMAQIHRDLGQLDVAKRTIEAAITLAESVRARVSSPNLRTSYLASWYRAYELGIDILMLLHARRPNEKFDEQAFVLSEKAKARSLQESVTDAQRRAQTNVEPGLLERERTLSEQLNAKAERQMKLLAAKQQVEAAKLEKEIETLTGEYDEVQDQIRATNPITASQSLSIKEVQDQVIDDDSLLLTFSLGEERSYLWLVTKTESSSYVLAGRKEIEKVAGELYKSVTAQQPLPGESANARYERRRAAGEVLPQQTTTLSEMLFGQLKGKLQGRRFLIVPDRSLQLIPFAALTNPETGETLVAQHDIMIEPSASALAVIKQAPALKYVPTRSVLIYADPVFESDDPRITRLAKNEKSSQQATSLRDVNLSNVDAIPRLFASGREADAIIATLPWKSGRKAVDFSASRESVLSDEIANYQILHFATHGAINSEHPELSGIVLSLFDEEGKSREGVLWLRDIYNLHIPAKLVVLSACSTGVGKDVRGEGPISLTRGFMYAGARSVVASLWKVDDEATAELMGHFYDGIFQKHLTPAAALRFAQLEMAKQPRWRSPYYWAGFVIQGQDLSNEAITQGVSWSMAEIALMTLSALTILFIPGVLLWLRRRRGLS